MNGRAAGPIAVLLAALALLPLAAGAEERESTHLTPPPQPPLVEVGQDNLAGLKEAFNAGVDRPRILVILSPT